MEKQMEKQKLLLVRNNLLLGDKIKNILNRKYTVIEIYFNSKNQKKMELYECNKIITYSEIENVEYIIFDSEIIFDYIENYSKKTIINWLIYLQKECKSHKIRLIYVYIKNPLELLLNSLKIKYISEYQIINETFIKIFVTEKKYLIFEADTIFGLGDLIDRSNYKNEKNMLDSIVNKFNIYPILADQAALYITNNLNKEGKYVIQGMDIDYGINVKRHQAKCAFNLVYQLEAQDYYFGKNIAEMRVVLGRDIAKSIPEEIIKKIDIVCPVPRSGMYYGMGLAEELLKPYVQALVKTEQEERSFQIADTDARKIFLWSKIKAIPELLKDKCVAVVDEAIFTGTTLKIVCEILRECKVKEIFLCIPTPKCKYHCDYLVHPERPMLLEYIKDSMLENYFNVDGIYFQYDINFKKILNFVNENMCAECFWGRED